MQRLMVHSRSVKYIFLLFHKGIRQEIIMLPITVANARVGLICIQYMQPMLLHILGTVQPQLFSVGHPTLPVMLLHNE